MFLVFVGIPRSGHADHVGVARGRAATLLHDCYTSNEDNTMIETTEREWTRQEALDELGITFGALRQLLADMEKARAARGVPMPRKGSDNGWRFNAADMDELRRAKVLAETKPHASVVRHLSAYQPEASGLQHLSSTPAAPEQQATASTELARLVMLMEQLVAVQAGQAIDPAQMASQVGAAVVPQVVEALARQNELTLQLGQASRKMGQLEGQLEAVTVERDRLAAELQQATALLAAPKKSWWPFGR